MQLSGSCSRSMSSSVMMSQLAPPHRLSAAGTLMQVQDGLFGIKLSSPGVGFRPSTFLIPGAETATWDADIALSCLLYILALYFNLE